MGTQLSVERLEDRTVPTTFMALNLADSGPDSLRAAVAAANANPGADVITFASSMQGTVTLTSGELIITDNLQINGPGAGLLSVSGNDASRVFQINVGAAVNIDGLTITHGRAVLRGGGIFNAGTLTLTNAIVSENQAIGLPSVTVGLPDAFGGGIFNTGTLTVRNTSFVHNQSLGADGNPSGRGSAGLGGAIMSVGTASVPATATVSDSTFLNNLAQGGAAGTGVPFTRNGLGGAIMNDAGTFTVSRSLFQDNRAVGGFGGGSVAGFGSGGAISNVARFGSATLSVSDSALINNQAVGGAGGTGQIGRGGAIANFVFGALTPPVSVAATMSVSNSTLIGNQAVGGAGPTGGTGQGGGISNENGGILNVFRSTIVQNKAIGGTGAGGTGGNGLGGGIFNGGTNPLGTSRLMLSRSLIVLNQADGGAAGTGGSAGLGVGGGLYLTAGGVAWADVVTAILANDASTSDDDVFGTLSR